VRGSNALQAPTAQGSILAASSQESGAAAYFDSDASAAFIKDMMSEERALIKALPNYFDLPNAGFGK